MFNHAINLLQVRANDLACSMSGNLKVMKGKKWKKYWFLLKDKVLYKYKASEVSFIIFCEN